MRDITSIKTSMSREEAKIVLQNFLKVEVLKPDNILRQEDISDVEEKGRRRIFQLFTFKDGTRWVLGNYGYSVY